MRKILLLFVFLLVGCSYNNTPSMAVESYLSRYQNLDRDVLNQLEVILDSNSNMTKKQKKEYKSLLQRQYQNLSYKITNEEVNNNKALVDVEIEVFDYATTNEKSREYFNEHKKELLKDEEDEIKVYNDYMLKNLKDVTTKTTYPIEFTVTKKNGIWKVNRLTQIDREKIHGLYKG